MTLDEVTEAMRALSRTDRVKLLNELLTTDVFGPAPPGELPVPLEPGDVVQLNPETCRNKAFAGCYLTVTEPKSFGCQGFVQALGETREEMGGQAYYRPQFDEMEYVGRARWVVASHG